MLTARSWGGALNVPNLLTLSRILLVPVFVDLIVYGYPRWALIVFLLAGLTDALDGMIARLMNQRTTLGRYLDPRYDHSGTTPNPMFVIPACRVSVIPACT